jgi:hypothetical protein
MKTFDANSIYQRLKARTRANGDFAVVAEDSTLNALLKSTADINSELARYMEYLLNEKKWDTAQNTSSLFTLCKMIGYKPHRKISAIGEVIVSHDERLANYLTTFFDLNGASEEDLSPGELTPNPTTTMTQHLRPWSNRRNGPNRINNDTLWSINEGDIFKTSSGATYLALETKEIKKYKTAFTTKELNSPNFTWEGYKYIRVPVIQGELKSTNITLDSTAVVPDFLSITLESSSIENAATDLTSKFFIVNVSSVNAQLAGIWNKVDSIISSGPYDKSFEVSTSSDFSKVYVKFGDNKSGLKPPPGATITIQYLSTLGLEGNIQKRLKINSLTSIVVASGLPGAGYNGIHGTIDPGTALSTLYCTNDTPILGGKDFESIEEIRKYAPLDYLKSYTISTSDSYETKIKDYFSYVDKIIAYSGQYTNPLTNLSKDVVYLSAIDTNGNPIVLEKTGSQFLTDALKLIGKKKSPTDTILYQNPEIVKLRINSKIGISIKNISIVNLSKKISTLLFSKYSIFSQEFAQSIFLSDINKIIDANSYVLNSRNTIEAVHEIDFSDLSKCTYNYSTKMFNFAFNFSHIFANNPSFAGFKTKYDGNVTYLLRVDVIWKESGYIPLNRTFFLYDTNESKRELGSDTGLRVAQFSQISNVIFDNTTMSNIIIPYSTSPKELNYYNTDSNGIETGTSTTNRNPLFVGGQISSSNPTRTAAATPQTVTITFSENHDISDSTYESGSISLPNTGGPGASFLAMFDYNGSTNEDLITYLNKLNDRVTIKVYAQPRAIDIIPFLENTIIVANEDDIVIEGVYV